VGSAMAQVPYLGSSRFNRRLDAAATVQTAVKSARTVWRLPPAGVAKTARMVSGQTTARAAVYTPWYAALEI